MAEKRINARIIHKHETEANWSLSSLIPMKGELIVYDIDDNYDYERIKIGDGVQNVNALPFYAGSWEDLSDKPFGQSISLGRVIAEEQVAEVDSGIVQTIEKKPLKENGIYLIKINGNEYISHSKYVDAASAYCCGNAFFAYPDFAEDTGEPFYVENDYMGSYKRVFLYTSLSDTEVTISITEVDGYSTQTLDEVYIPETIARVSYVEDAIAAIPTPDVSEQIGIHNTSETAHSDIREAIGAVSTLVGDTSVSEQIESAQIVYVGPTQPTDPNIKVWINTAEEGTGIVPVLPRVATITLAAASWTGSASPYYQTVTINTVTSATKIDLQPTVAQITSLQNADIALMAENTNGTVKVYSFGGKPSADMTMQALLTEVSYV